MEKGQPPGHQRRRTLPALALAGALALAPIATAQPAGDATVPPDPAAEAAARAAFAEGLDLLRPWLTTLAATAGTHAEMTWRKRHARLATAAQSPHALAYWQALVADARAQEMRSVRRQAQSNISNIGYSRGDYALTRAVEEESLADALRIGSRREQAESLQDLGLVATVTGDPDLAEQYFREAIAIWETLDVPMGLARGQRGLARVQEMKGRYPQAMESHVAALELMLRHGTAIEQSESYYSLARLFLNLEDYEAGLRAVDEAIRLMGPVPPDFPLGLNLATRSWLLRYADRLDEAVADGRAAVAAFERIGNPMGVAIGHLALGQALVLAGDAEAGLPMLAAAIDTARAQGEKSLESDLLLAQGSMLVHLQRYEEAEPPLQAAMAIGDELGLDRLRQDVALAMETLHSARGRPAEALLWSRRAFEYRGRLSALGDIAELGSGTADGPIGRARQRFMALEPAPPAPASTPVTAAAAAADRAPPRRWWWLLAVPSLLLLWGLVRVLRSSRRLRHEKETIALRQRELESAHDLLQTHTERLRRQVAVDPLTGAMTRTAFAAELDSLLRHASAHDRPVALLVFDLDHFKNINDVHGHLAGDEALRLVTGIAREKLRSQDLLGRFGGDEFLVAVPGLDVAGAEALAETIRFDVVWRAPDQSPPMPDLSISVGLAVADPGRGYDAEALFRRADGALYRAKRSGRNRVMADDPAATGTVVPDDRHPRQWTMALPD